MPHARGVAPVGRDQPATRQLITIDEDGRTPSHRVRRGPAGSDLYAALSVTPSGSCPVSA